MAIRRILHASDFSKASQPAFRLARELARTFKAELIIFNAADTIVPVLGEGYVSPALVNEVWEAGRQQAQRGVDGLVKAARAERLRVRGLVGEGPAAAAIVAAAKRQRAHMIVMGTHGRSGVRRLLIGSVAERVVRTAPCPVTTVGA
jgi:nucleotide-binding universal stress UspA family protein